MYRKTFAAIDLDALKNNAAVITKAYPSYRYYIAVVKANAYGHGPYVVNALIEGGINYLAVSSLEEALELRSYHATIPILILEPCGAEWIPILTENDLTLTVDSLAEARKISALSLKKPLKVHIKLDCGMNRLGLQRKDDLQETLSLFEKNPEIIPEGIYTHLGTAGISDVFYDRSLLRFRELTADVDLKRFPIVHIHRSMTLTHHKPLEWETGVRLGILLFGFNQSIPEPKGLRRLKREWMLKRNGISRAILENHLPMKTAFSLKSQVISLRKVKKGDTVGYGTEYIAPVDHPAATISIGLYDGMKDGMRFVSIRGKRYPIIGKVCMDMAIVRVDESVRLHDSVEIFGNEIPIREVCSDCHINAYQLLTSVSTRVPRVYSDGTEIKY